MTLLPDDAFDFDESWIPAYLLRPPASFLPRPSLFASRPSKVAAIPRERERETTPNYTSISRGAKGGRGRRTARLPSTPPRRSIGDGDAEGDGAVGGVGEAPAVPRPRQDPRRRPPGHVLRPPVRPQGGPLHRRRPPRGPAPPDAPRVARRAQRPVPRLLPPGSTFPLQSAVCLCRVCFAGV